MGSVISAARGDKKKVTLITSDKEYFEVTEAVAKMSQTISYMIEDGYTDGGIPIPNVTASVLSKILEYCTKHAIATAQTENSSDTATAAESKEKELKSFDESFINVDQAVLYDLILAANYLEVKGLLDLACQRVADMIRGKSVEEMRQIFTIKNDFTPEEEAKLRGENSWAFE